MKGNGGESPGEKVLRQRAKALARRNASPVRAEDQLALLEFRLADERYAVEQRFVVAVHALRQLTPLPCTPAHLLGIVNVQGRILPVIDLKKFFELPERGLSDLHRIVHIACGGLEFGLLADLGVELAHVARAALQPSLATLTGVRADYLLGVGPGGLVVLDTARIAADPRIVVNEEVEATQ